MILAGYLRSVAPHLGGGDAAPRLDRSGGHRWHEPLRRPRRRAEALLGAAVIATIANGLFILGYQPGAIFIITGCILLFAVTLDTLARRRQAKTGR